MGDGQMHAQTWMARGARQARLRRALKSGDNHGISIIEKQHSFRKKPIPVDYSHTLRMSQSFNFDDVMEKGEAVGMEEPPAALPHHSTPASPTSTGTTLKDSEIDLKNSNDSDQVASSSKCRVHLMRRIQQSITRKTPKMAKTAVYKGRNSIVRSLDDAPAGYPRLAAFLDSDENFMLYRRFGFLQARVLLYKQDELRAFEKELDRMDKRDKRDSETRPKKLKSRVRDDADNLDRRNLILNITKTFKEYTELLTSARDLASFNRPPARDYRSVKNYFNSAAPLCNEESFIYRKEDIITLKPGRENAWLDALVERLLQKLSCPRIQKWFSDEDLRKKTDPKATKIILYSRERINLVVSFLIVIMILVLLIVPVYILWKVSQTKHFTNATTAALIGTLLVFTLVFSGVLSLFTRAKRHEILAAAAGYCAVLVVFIGNIGQLSSAH